MTGPEALAPDGAGASTALDQARDLLNTLSEPAGLPLSRQLEGFAEVHRLLQGALADLEGD